MIKTTPATPPTTPPAIAPVWLEEEFAGEPVLVAESVDVMAGLMVNLDSDFIRQN